MVRVGSPGYTSGRGAYMDAAHLPLIVAAYVVLCWWVQAENVQVGRDAVVRVAIDRIHLAARAVNALIEPEQCWCGALKVRPDPILGDARRIPFSDLAGVALVPVHAHVCTHGSEGASTLMSL